MLKAGNKSDFTLEDVLEADLGGKRLCIGVRMSHIWQTVYPILIAILFFELIIIVHEGGLFCRQADENQVNEFSIGMGPKIFRIY